jgi:hypothetical protein
VARKGENRLKNYKVEVNYYKSGKKIELWRKNARYGYYNFVCYLEKESDFEKVAYDDMKNKHSEWE